MKPPLSFRRTIGGLCGGCKQGGRGGDLREEEIATGSFGPREEEGAYRSCVGRHAMRREAFLLDSDMLGMKVLRKIASDPNVVTNADSEAGVIIGEHTLAVKNEAGLGVVADVFGLTSST